MGNNIERELIGTGAKFRCYVLHCLPQVGAV